MKRRYILHGECNQCGDCCQNEDCEHLERISQGKWGCKIHNDPNRPLKCKLYPEMPPIVFRRCSYYFRDTYENNRLVRPGEV